MSMKNPMTPSEIKPVTFQYVAPQQTAAPRAPTYTDVLVFTAAEDPQGRS
jgi:hypothetical protein